MAIHFFFQKPVASLKQRLQLKRFLLTIFKKEKHPLSSLTYIFCSDDELLEINLQFLKHDYYTDIITFNLAAKHAPIEGEIYISIDRVKENALQLGTTIKEELHRVIFHGALHLCGYKDKSKTHQLEMRKAEDRYIKLYRPLCST
jgi:probable rRNA maturation factor